MTTGLPHAAVTAAALAKSAPTSGACSLVLKRIFDIAAATGALIVLAIPMAIVAILVRWKLGSPVLFRQQRPGLNGRPFMFIKFRSMSDARDENGELLPDAERLPKFGAWLRSTSLDELPQLFNVLAGDMSIVGPRPLLMSYLDHYTTEQARRHEVRPGITGWAQVNGRNALDWPERLALDVWYVDNRTFLLDLKIMAMTVNKIIARDGVSAPGHVTMRRLDETRREP